MKTRPALFTVIFEDKTSFVGGTNYLETKWTEIPNKKIQNLLYKLPHGDYLCLSGYEEYYHMIEATTDLNGKRKGEVQFEYAYIMGKIGERVIVYKISLRYTDMTIVKSVVDSKNEWILKLNSNGWK